MNPSSVQPMDTVPPWRNEIIWHFAAAMCYLRASEGDWNDPKIFAYYAQCQLKGPFVYDGGLMGGYEAGKIAIRLEPTSASWHIINAIVLTRIHLYTPFNVKGLILREVTTADACKNKTTDNINALDGLIAFIRFTGF